MILRLAVFTDLDECLAVGDIPYSEGQSFDGDFEEKVMEMVHGLAWEADHK